MLTPYGDGVQEQSESRSGGKPPLLIALGSLIAFVGVVAYGAVGVRGSDQYWYLTDLQMVNAGRGMVANMISPVLWNSAEGFGPGNLPPPIHHVPVTYLAAMINALVDNPYLAWVVCDGLLAVGGAWLLSLVARTVVRPTTAAIVGAVFLLSPQTVWFTLNPLMEQSLAFAAIVLALGTVWLFQRAWLGAVVMAVAVAFMAVTRASNLALILAGLVLLAMFAWRRRTSWWLVGLFGGLSVVLWWIGGRLLPQYPLFGVKAMLALGTPADVRALGLSLPFYTQDVDVSIPMMARKAFKGLGQAFVPASAQELLMETAVVALLLFGLWLGTRSSRGKALAWWGAALFAVYLLTSALMQSQSRYVAPVLPFAIVLGAAGVERLGGRAELRPAALRLGVAASALILLAATTATAMLYVQSASEAKRSDAELAAALEPWNPGTTLILDDPGKLVPGDSVDLNTLAAAQLLAPELVVIAEGTEPDTCVPLAEVQRWEVARVIAPIGWSDAQILDAFCPSPGVSAPELVPAGDGLQPYGRQMLLVQ